MPFQRLPPAAARVWTDGSNTWWTGCPLRSPLHKASSIEIAKGKADLKLARYLRKYHGFTLTPWALDKSGWVRRWVKIEQPVPQG